jgi:hypothetical protein
MAGKFGNNCLTYTSSLATSTVIALNDGFVVDNDGVLKCTFRGDLATDANDSDFEVSLPVLKGVHYSYDIAKFNITGSTAVTQVWVVFGLNH